MTSENKGLGSTSKFKVASILKDDGNFAIAVGIWDGEGPAYACRWHDNGNSCGYPQTFGKPQWLLLPSGSVRVIFVKREDGSLEKRVILEF